VGSNYYCVTWGPLTAKEQERFEIETSSQDVQLQIAAKPSVLCCHLANKTNSFVFCRIALVLVDISFAMFTTVA